MTNAQEDDIFERKKNNIYFLMDKTSVSSRLLEKFSAEEIAKCAKRGRWTGALPLTVVFSAAATTAGLVGSLPAIAALSLVAAGLLAGVWGAYLYECKQTIISHVTWRAAEFAERPAAKLDRPPAIDPEVLGPK